MSDIPQNLAIPDRVDLVFVVENQDRYYLALGRFVHLFSAVEAIMHAYHAHVAGVSLETANAVFSGVRMRVQRDNIRRVHATKSKPLNPAYEHVLEQMKIIMDVRDAIIHHGATFAEGEPKHVTNARRAHTAEATKTFPISAKLLNAMTDDLDDIKFYIQAALWRDLLKPRDHQMMFGDLPLPAWRYKHPPPKNQNQQSPNKSRGRRSPPE